MTINNFQSNVGTQVVGTQNVHGGVSISFDAVRSDLSSLVVDYVQRLEKLTAAEAEELKQLASLQAAVCAERPKPSAIKKLLGAVTGIAAAADIVEKIHSLLSNAA
jgi:hypothetical protein